MINTVIDCWRHMVCRRFKTSRPVVKSRAPVGSSHKRIFGLLAIARAMATLCCSPPDSVFQGLNWIKVVSADL